MAEVAVVKQSKPEVSEPVRWPLEPAFMRGNLFNWNPFALMRQFTDDMDRLFGQMSRPEFRPEKDLWCPAMEVKQKDGKLLVTAELPGVKKEDVKVHIDGDMLVVEGERKQEKEEKREGFYHSERSYGKFLRSLPLPEGAVFDQTAAQLNNGVLEITIPVPEAKNKRQDVPVQEGPKKAA